MTTPNRRFFIGNQQPNSYHASLRRSSALSTPPSSFNFNSSPSSPPSVNPDPLPSRRKSFDTLDKMDQYPSLYNTRTRSGSTGDLSLSPPNPPFAATATRNSYRDSSGSDMSSSSSFDSPGGVYRNSAAAHLVTSQSSPNVSDSFGGSYPASLYGGGGGTYSPSASQVNFRPAFLSPASRPSSSLQGWVPPTSSASSVDGFPSMMGATTTSTGVGVGLRATSRNASRTNIRPSTLLVKESVPSLKAKAAATPALPGDENEKHLSPPLPPPPVVEKTSSPLYPTQPLPRTRTARYLTLLCILIGLVGAAILCFTGVQEAKSSLLDEGSLCLVMDEDWGSGMLDGGRWGKEVELGGFGNGEFQMTTAGDKNVYIKNGELYIFPTLTSEDVPDWDQDGKQYVLEGCTGAGGVPAPSSSNSTSNGGGNGNGTDTSGGGNSTTTDNSDGGGTTTNGGGKNNGGGGDNTGNGAVRRWLLPRQRATVTHSSSASSPSASSNSTQSSSTNSTSSSPSSSSPSVSNPNTSGPGRDTNACVAETSYGGGTVVNPVMSGRVSTRGKVGVRYGRVEVVGKVGRGDWLWPAIWMLPENNTYGAWPLSGEIDIMEARGNAPTYPAQGVNYVRSSLNYGLSKGLLPIAVQGGVTPEPLTKSLYGWFSLKRTSFDQAFHTYAVEWDEDFMRFYVDSRVKATLQLKVDVKKGGKGKNGKTDNFFWDKGKFPATAQNGTTGQVEVVENPWEEGGKNSPFDQKFYLILDHAVGGTSGWFPDELGNKPWYDGSLTAMRDFAKAKDEWYPTWGSGEDDRAFRIKSVKMWSRECS